jgi:hypothetical protein
VIVESFEQKNREQLFPEQEQVLINMLHTSLCRKEKERLAQEEEEWLEDEEVGAILEDDEESLEEEDDSENSVKVSCSWL